MAHLSYAVKEGLVIGSSSKLAWATQLDRYFPIGEVYVYRDFDGPSPWRVLQRATEHYGMPRTAAQMLPIMYEQLPEVVQMAFIMKD